MKQYPHFFTLASVQLYIAVMYTGLKCTVAELKYRYIAIQLIQAQCVHHIDSVKLCRQTGSSKVWESF